MKKYRKRPVVIEATELTSENFREVLDWINTGDREGWIDLRGGGLGIKTLEGNMIARPGDFVIRGVQGEFYPCRGDIFRETYEEVTDGE